MGLSYPLPASPGHCHPVAKAAPHTVNVAKGKAKGKAKFQVGPDAEVS